MEPCGIILSGGPSSVYEEGSPHVKQEVWDYIEANKIPVLGICYGMQEIAHIFGGQVSLSLTSSINNVNNNNNTIIGITIN